MSKAAKKTPKHQPIPELLQALAMPPEKRAMAYNKKAIKGSGWAMGTHLVRTH